MTGLIHIVVCRKPVEGTVAENCLQHGCGVINVDGCRIELNGDYKCKANGRPSQTGLGDKYNPMMANKPDTSGRWPANMILDKSEEVQGLFPKEAGASGKASGPTRGKWKSVWTNQREIRNTGSIWFSEWGYG